MQEEYIHGWVPKLESNVLGLGIDFLKIFSEKKRNKTKLEKPTNDVAVETVFFFQLGYFIFTPISVEKIRRDKTA